MRSCKPICWPHIYHGFCTWNESLLAACVRLWGFTFPDTKSHCKKGEVYIAKAYPSFSSMKRLGIFLLPPGWDATVVHRRIHKYHCTHIRNTVCILKVWIDKKSVSVLSFSRYHQKYMLRQRHTLLRSLGLNDEELKKSRVAARLNGYVGGFGSLKSFEAEVDELKLSKAQADLVKEIIGRKRF